MKARKGALLLLTLLVCVAGWLRFQRLRDEAPIPDEVTYTGRAVLLKETGRSDASDHPPLFWALAALLLAVTSDPLFAGRLVSAVAGTLAILATAFLFAFEGGWKHALLAAVALALLSFHVHWSRLAELDVLFLLFVTSAYAAWFKARATGGLPWYLLAGVFLGAGASAKYPAAGALGVMGLHVLLNARRIRDVLNLKHVALVLAFAIAVLPAVFAMVSAGHTGVSYHTKDRYAAGDVDAVPISFPGSALRAAKDLVKVIGGFSSSDGTALKAGVSAAVSLLLLSFIAYGLRLLRRDRPIGLAFIHVAFYFTFFTFFPVKFPYYHLTEAVLLVPILPLVAIGWFREESTAVPRRVRSWAGIATVAVLAIVLVFNAVRATAWPRDSGDVTALVTVFERLAEGTPAGERRKVALDAGFYDLCRALEARGRMGSSLDRLEIVKQDVNLKRVTPEALLTELVATGATTLVLSDQKTGQKGFAELERLLSARLSMRRRESPALPSRFPVFAAGP